MKKKQHNIIEVLASVCLTLSLAGLLLFRVADARAAEPELVARVNGEPVTRGELQNMLAAPLTRHQLEQELGGEKTDDKELESLALRKLIERRLILQEAGRRNFKVTEQDLDQALAVLRRDFKDLKDFGVWMKERGLDDKSLFEAIRADISMKRAMGALVKDVRPAEKEVRDYYETHKEELTIGMEVRLRIIVVKSRAEAEAVLSALRNGENFSGLARKRSLGQHAGRGGDMGWVNFQALPPPLQSAVGLLKAGDVGGPLQKSDDEFLIVGLQDHRPIKPKSLTEARPEIEQRLLPAKQQKIIQTWLKEQKRNSKVDVFTHETDAETGGP